MRSRPAEAQPAMGRRREPTGGVAPPSSVYGTEVLLLNYAGTTNVGERGWTCTTGWRFCGPLRSLLRHAPGILEAGLRVARSLRAYEAREATAPALPQCFPRFGGRGGCCPRNARSSRAARLAAGCGHLSIRVSSVFLL